MKKKMILIFFVFEVSFSNMHVLYIILFIYVMLLMLVMMLVEVGIKLWVILLGVFSLLLGLLWVR